MFKPIDYLARNTTTLTFAKVWTTLGGSLHNLRPPAAQPLHIMEARPIAVDAFMFPLKGENPYYFPLVICIPQVL